MITTEELLIKYTLAEIAQLKDNCIAALTPKGNLVMPMLTSDYHSDKKWHWDSIVKLMQTVNPDVEVTKELAQKTMKRVKMTMAKCSAPIPAIMLEQITVTQLKEAFGRQQGCFVYRKSNQVLIHKFLHTILDVDDEGARSTKWKSNPFSPNPIAASAFTDPTINKNKKLPDLEIEIGIPTPEMIHALKTGLTKRHLTPQRHYNYRLIEAELYMQYGVLVDARELSLMPKEFIDQSK